VSRHGLEPAGRLASLLVGLAIAGAAPEAAAIMTSTDAAERAALAFRVFTDAEGLPHNTVHAIRLDRSGLLWIATQDGAACYDGRSWRVVDMPQPARSNFVRSILPANDGSLWFATQANGVHQLIDGGWARLPGYPDGRDFARVNALLETVDPDGGRVLWIGTHDGGVLRCAGGRCDAFAEADGLPARRVWALHAEPAVGRGTTIWAGTESGLARLAPGAVRFEPVTGFPRVSVNSLLTTVASDGRRVLWVGTYGAGLGVFEAGRWRVLGSAEGLPSEFVTSLAGSRFGGSGTGVWVGTDGGGLARIDGGSLLTIDVRSGLPTNAVYSVFEIAVADGTPSLWVGTRNGGLARLTEGAWRRVRPIAAAPRAPVTGFAETVDPNGTPVYWLGTDGGGLARLDRNGTTVFDQARGSLPIDAVVCVLASGDETTLWVGTRNGGLARLRRGIWQTVSTATGELPNDLVQTLLETEDRTGGRTLWVGTRGGLARLQGGRWTTLDRAAGLASDSVLALLETVDAKAARTLWIGTADGLARLSDGAVVVDPISEVLPNRSVLSLHASSSAGRRSLWIGTDGGGLLRVDLDGVTAPLLLDTNSRPALPSNTIYHVLEDRAGRLYLLTNRGVVRLTRDPDPEPGALAYEVFVYGGDDGLPAGQCNRGAGLVDRRGRVWAGTIAGAALLDPDREVIDGTPKRLYVQGSAGRPPRPLDDGASLTYRERPLLFDYALLSFFRERDTRYRTQLAGLDDAPSEWTADAKREYPTLPDGDYVFRVWGRDYAGNVTGPIELAFAVRPAPWNSWWANILYLFGLAAIILAGIRLRLRAHQRRERELVALVDARTRRLAEANRLLTDLSYLDPLTDIANRRRFDELLPLEWKRALRVGQRIALIMIDVDHFKPFNDRFGHLVGDQCLRAVALTLADGLPRAGDSVARYGGEEFAVILPATDLLGAYHVAEQLRRRVAALQVATQAAPPTAGVTVSCGVTSMSAAFDLEAAELVRRADAALYRAKQAGGNCTATDAE
jgi:diguanylate cyclase (GGDEF)-like protein